MGLEVWGEGPFGSRTDVVSMFYSTWSDMIDFVGKEGIMGDGDNHTDLAPVLPLWKAALERQRLICHPIPLGTEEIDENEGDVDDDDDYDDEIDAPPGETYFLAKLASVYEILRECVEKQWTFRCE
jgi:hypothetical protein